MNAGQFLRIQTIRRYTGDQVTRKFPEVKSASTKVIIYESSHGSTKTVLTPNEPDYKPSKHRQR